MIERSIMQAKSVMSPAMSTSQLLVRRIRPILRPLRPPNTVQQRTSPRRFTQNSQLLLVSQYSPRPQLPFLAPSSGRITSQQLPGQWQLSRLITTETKNYLKEQGKLGVKYTLYGWAILAMIVVAGFGASIARLEQRFEAPDEWSYFARLNFRRAKAQETPEYFGNVKTDWAITGATYKLVLEKLEDPKKDGKGLMEQDEGGILIPGVGKAGFNLEGKSEQWRQGYFDCLMGCAKAAERLDGWVKDTSRNMVFPGECVVGPSNPNPRPTPRDSISRVAPLEENCQPAFDPPETFYMKVLTSKGLTTEQRLSAAIAYADFLDFKNQHDAAGEMYKWAMDIACSGVPDASSIIHPSSGVIAESAPYVTPNILKAATALATHHAQTSNVSSALPIYLSVLRARRAAPPTPERSSRSGNAEPSPLDMVKAFFSPKTYGPLSHAGDAPLQRSAEEQCDEAAIMTYIGEILFATSKSERDAGLSWTREAVEAAEHGMRNPGFDKETRDKCRKCAEVGLENWAAMAQQLAREQKEKAGKKAAAWGGFWSRGEQVPDDRWEREEKDVEERLATLRTERLREMFGAAAGSGRMSII